MVKGNNIRDDNMQQFEKSQPVKYEDTFGFYTIYSNKLLYEGIKYALIGWTLIALPSFMTTEPTCAYAKRPYVKQI